jgi:hypothetical protein
MPVSGVWYAALSIVADFSPMAYWRMSNAAAFWWVLTSRTQLLDDRFSEQPFAYAEIVSVCVFSEVRFCQEVLSCDLPALRQGLLNIPGLRVDEMRDVNIPPAFPPNQALCLTVAP